MDNPHNSIRRVYLAVQSDYDVYEVAGAFTTREKAEAFIEAEESKARRGKRATTNWIIDDVLLDPSSYAEVLANT